MRSEEYKVTSSTKLIFVNNQSNVVNMRPKLTINLELRTSDNNIVIFELCACVLYHNHHSTTIIRRWNDTAS